MKKHFNKKELIEFIDALVDTISATIPKGETPCILGIRKGGAPLADALAEGLLKKIRSVDVGYIDVSLYRDDIHRRLPDGPMEGTDIAFSLENRSIILVDDVLYTGRTIRAALGHVMALGRPCSIRLATLVDRGGRELPIQADFCGVDMKDHDASRIRVQFNGDKNDGIYCTYA